MFLLFAYAHAEDLYVSSNERGAAILLNGVDTGYTTPATVPGVKIGETLVTVESGCARGEKVVMIEKGLITRVSIVAEEQLGTLTIVPSPANARIELDNEPYTGAPGITTALSCGEHTVRAVLEGHVTAVLAIEVAMGQDLTVPISLQKLGIGTLDLSVKPRSATLYLDGKRVGSDAVTLPSVYQGVHTISAELDGYRAAKKQVVVEEGGSQAFHFELARASSKDASTVTRLGGASATSGEGSGATRADVAVLEDPPAPTRSRNTTQDRDTTKDRDAERRREAEEARAAEEEAREAEARREAEVDREAAEREAEAREAEEAHEAAASREAEAERRAEEREAREAERRSEARRQGATVVVKTGPSEKKDGPPVGKIVGGVSLLAAGAGAGAFAIVAYDDASRAYEAYSTKISGATGDKQRERLAEIYYDENVAPSRNLLYGSAIGSGLFLAGGIVVLAIDERLPILAPAPGGGMVLWNGRF